MKKLSIIPLIVLLAALLLNTANAALIFSDNFDTENGGSGALNYTGFTNWSVQPGTVDLIGNGYYDFIPGNGLYVDMDGSTGNAGTMTKTLTLGPGSYLLTFALAGNHNNTSLEFVDVMVKIGLASQRYSRSQNDPFINENLYFNVGTGGTYTLSFSGVGGDNIGMLLDNVSLNSVPIPGAAYLLGTGLIGLVAIRRRGLK
jgi:hypothetical protein